MTGLAGRRIVGVRASDGRVYAPPVEYDPVTLAAVSDFVEVADEGVVTTWCWAPEPMAGQPLEHPFAWAMVRLDGADTAMLHALDAGSPEAVRTGMRVRARWAAERAGNIHDIVCFEPAVGQRASAADTTASADSRASEDSPTVEPAAEPAAEPIQMITTPVSLRVQHSASPQETTYLLGLQEGRLIAQRCPQCHKVYMPPRGACPVDGVPTTDEVELPDRGIVTTFCIVNVPFYGQKITPPYVAAYVLLDGADIAFLHLILECAAEDVRMGMRVEARWRPREDWVPGLQNIEYFRPTGEPDAPYDSFKEHL
jgi:hypothetical protein